MFAEKKAEWVAALRSGEWDQAQEVLKQTKVYSAEDEMDVELPKPRYCCLGVLCELNGYDWGRYGLEDDDEMLPPVVRDVVGGFDDAVVGTAASGPLPFQDRKGVHVTLVDCNDSGMTFPQIADLIEMFY